jgi:hypothetical protein
MDTFDNNINQNLVDSQNYQNKYNANQNIRFPVESNQYANQQQYLPQNQQMYMVDLNQNNQN